MNTYAKYVIDYLREQGHSKKNPISRERAKKLRHVGPDTLAYLEQIGWVVPPLEVRFIARKKAQTRFQLPCLQLKVTKPSRLRKTFPRSKPALIESYASVSPQSGFNEFRKTG